MLRTKSIALGCSLLVLAACAQPGGQPPAEKSADSAQGLTSTQSQAVSPVNDPSLPLVARALNAKYALTKAYGDQLMTDEDALNYYRLSADMSGVGLGSAAMYVGAKQASAARIQLAIKALQEQVEIVRASTYFRENIAALGKSPLEMSYSEIVAKAAPMKPGVGLFTADQIDRAMIKSKDGHYYRYRDPVKVAQITEKVNKALIDSISPTLLRRMADAMKSKKGAKALGQYAVESTVSKYNAVAGAVSSGVNSGLEIGKTAMAAAAERASMEYLNQKIASLGTKEGLKAVYGAPIAAGSAVFNSGFQTGQAVQRTIKKYAGSELTDSEKLFRSRALMSVGIAILGYTLYDAISELNDNHVFGSPDYVSYDPKELMKPEMRAVVLRMAPDQFLTVAGKKGNEEFAQYMVDWFNSEANPAVLPAPIE